MKRTSTQSKWLFILALLWPAAAQAQELLSLRQAIQMALKQNPEAALVRAESEQAKAGLRMARTQFLPQVSLTEDISRGDDPVYAFGMRLRQQRFTLADFALDRLNTPAAMGNFSTRVSGQWLLFDSMHREKSVRGAQFVAQSVQQAVLAVDQKLVFGAVAAYQAILYTERQVAVAQHQLETAQALRDSAADHVKAGLAVESDRISAEVNVAACQQTLIAAQGERDLAWAQLRLATGEPELKASGLKPIEPREFPQSDLEQAVLSAERNRKDLASIDAMQSAQAQALSASKAAFGPKLAAYGNWESARASFAGSGGNNWVAGVQLSVDLLPMGKRAQLAADTAAKARVDAQASSYRQQLRLQVTQAHIQRRTAQQSLLTAKTAVDQAAESLRILRNRYNAGLATITDLLRAEDAERQAQSNYWRAVYGNALAYAQLLFATGTLTPDAAEVLQ